MSDICRFDNNNDGDCPRHPDGCAEALYPKITGYSVAGVIEADPDNEFVWVKFADCSAAVAAARDEGYASGRRDGYDQGVEQGQRDELDTRRHSDE
jgi:hypothetical protein